MKIPRLNGDTKDIEVTPGLYELSNDDYHSSIGISNSGISEFMRSPHHYWYRYLSNQYKASNRSNEKEFGSAFHTYLLENDLFWQEYIVAPNINKNTKAWKAFFTQCGNKKLIDEDDLEKCEQMANAIMSNPVAAKLIKCAKKEKSLYWYDEDEQVLVKARPDLMFDGMLADLKTTVSAKEDDYRWSLRRYGYYRQAALALDGFKAITGKVTNVFMHVVIEKEPPYAVAVYQIDEGRIREGRVEYKEQLHAYRHCLLKNEWPSYGNNSIQLI